MNDTIKAIEVSFYDKENSLQLASDIYTTHVKPLEDALAKAEERERMLVKVVEDFLLLHQGKGRGDERMQARAALSRSKGE